MPFNPFVALSAPAALGATLLGVAASLLVLDVTGTVVLDRSRAADAVARTSLAVAPSLVQPAAGALPSAGAPRASAPSVARAHVIAPRAVASSPARALRAPVLVVHARDTRVAIVARHLARSTSERIALVTYATLPQPIVVAQTRRTAPAVAAPHVAVVALAVPRLVKSAAPAERPIASLRDVRRFVIRALRARDRRVCAISATAYTAHDGHVVVDLVLRSRKARWSEKAVVRRSGTDLKLIGVKARALPYWTIASSGTVPGQ